MDFLLIGICDALIKAKEEGLDAFTALDGVMPWNKIVESVEEAKQLSRPVNYDYLDLLENRYSYLRKYTPTLLQTFKFGATKSAEPVLQALTELRNYIRSGDIFVPGSRQHKAFDDYLIPQDNWKSVTRVQDYLAVPLRVEEYLMERIGSLNQRLDWLSQNSNDLEGVDIAKGKFYVHRLDKDTPEEAKAYSSHLYSMLPRVKLTDLLLEVASWTGFHEQFIHASSNKSPNGGSSACPSS